MRCKLATKWHDGQVKKLLMPAILVALSLTFSGLALATNTGASDTSTSDTSIPAVYDLENEPSQCIGLLPRPGCGKEPEDAGERGGVRGPSREICGAGEAINSDVVVATVDENEFGEACRGRPG